MSSQDPIVAVDGKAIDPEAMAARRGIRKLKDCNVAIWLTREFRISVV